MRTRWRKSDCHPAATWRRSDCHFGAIVVGLVLAGCGGGPEPEEEVRRTLRDFGDVVARRDVQALCDRLLARSLISEVTRAGLPCEVAVRPALQAARKPRLEIRSVSVQGDRAEAVVRTTAANQPPSTDRVRLVREGGRWKVASLAG